MQGGELIENNISDAPSRKTGTNKTAGRQLAGEREVSATVQDLFEDDLYVWSLLLVDKELFKEDPR